ncbi:MAG TPA: ABC transporter permease [Acidimicrobiales bacterium]|nr:ABC transporter permease [Acidimicrobiales bacterium]
MIRRRAPLVITAALFAGTYLLWHQLTASGTVHEVVLPTPGSVGESITEVVQRDTFAEHLRVTATEVLTGFALGSISAILLALVCERSRSVRRLITPYVVALQALPKVVLLPLLYVWFGVGYRATTVMVVLVVFFPVYLNTLTGLSIADPDGTRLLRSLGATPRQRFRYHQVPSALPLIFTGLKTAVYFAVAAALAAELLGARYGLGFLIANAGNFLRIPDLYATVLIAGVFSGLVYLTFEVLDRKLIYWRPRDDRR